MRHILGVYQVVTVTHRHVLQVVVDVMEPGKLVLYPQILLACTALLGISFVHLWRLLLDLFSKVSLKSC